MGGSCLASWNDGGHQAVWISFQSPLRVHHAGKHREKGTRGGSKVEGSAVRGGSSLHLVSQLGKPKFVLLHNFSVGNGAPDWLKNRLLRTTKDPGACRSFLLLCHSAPESPQFSTCKGPQEHRDRESDRRKVSRK